MRFILGFIFSCALCASSVQAAENPFPNPDFETVLEWNKVAVPVSYEELKGLVLEGVCLRKDQVNSVDYLVLLSRTVKSPETLSTEQTEMTLMMHGWGISSDGRRLHLSREAALSKARWLWGPDSVLVKDIKAPAFYGNEEHGGAVKKFGDLYILVIEPKVWFPVNACYFYRDVRD